MIGLVVQVALVSAVALTSLAVIALTMGKLSFLAGGKLAFQACSYVGLYEPGKPVIHDALTEIGLGMFEMISVIAASMIFLIINAVFYATSRFLSRVWNEVE